MSIRVGESFGTPSAPTFISIGGDIRSQILFNDRALSGQTFNGVITAKAASASPVTISAAEYAQTAASLGGGGAGLVPFPAHKESCSPVHLSTVSGGLVPTPTKPIVVRHYSHVTSAATQYVFGAMPVTVGRRVCGSTGSFVDCSNCFRHDIDPTAPQRVRVYPKYRLPTGYEFNVKPVLTGTRILKCDVAAGTDPAVTDYDYTFCTAVVPSAEEALPCVADLNGDGSVNTEDLTVFLAQFGLSDWCVGDLNQDGAVNTADLVIFLGAFGGTCPSIADPEEEEMLRGGGSGRVPSLLVGPAETARVRGEVAGPGSATASMTQPPLPPVLTALGFASEAEYLAFVDSLDERGLEEHIAELLATIHALGLD